MNGKVKTIALNIYRAVSVNLLRLLISVVLTLLLPKVMGVESFSYWQLYLFYSIYASFSSLGWCEGLYLTYGGMEYSALPKKKIAGQFAGLAIYEVIFSLTAILVFTSLTDDYAKKLVILLTFMAALFEILRYSVQSILQTTNRIKDYAHVAAAERILFFFLAMLCVLTGHREFFHIILCEVISKFLAMCYVLFICRDMIFVRGLTFSVIVCESKKMVHAGYKLLCAIFASQLILGIIRFAIEHQWGTIIFGQVSLTLSIANMIITAISAISIVIFPMLRQMGEEKRQRLYAPIRTLLLLPQLLFLCLYPLILLVLGWWLPQYYNSLRYLAILLPFCVYESRNLILTDTYFKAYQRTGMLLWINVATIVLSCILTGISVYWLKSLDFAVITIVLLVSFKNVLSEYLLGKIAGVFRLRAIAEEALLMMVYIGSHWFWKHPFSPWLYPVVLVVYLLVNRQGIMNVWRQFLALASRNEVPT